MRQEHHRRATPFRPALPPELERAFAVADTKSAVAYSLWEQGFDSLDAMVEDGDAVILAELDEGDSIVQHLTSPPHGRQDPT